MRVEGEDLVVACQLGRFDESRVGKIHRVIRVSGHSLCDLCDVVAGEWRDREHATIDEIKQGGLSAETDVPGE